MNFLLRPMKVLVTTHGASTTWQALLGKQTVFIFKDLALGETDPIINCNLGWNLLGAPESVVKR